MRATPRRTTSIQYSLKKTLLTTITWGMMVFALWYGWHYTKPDNFPIRHVKIFATYEHLDQQTLQKTIANYLDNGFFYLNVLGLKRQLLKLPWVATVAIERQWPDTVMIRLEEQRAVLQWGTTALVNEKGVIFTPPPSSFPRNLPLIFGAQERSSEIGTLYYQMLGLLKPLNLTIKKLLLNPEHYWELLLSNGTVIYLKEEHPIAQLELLANIYTKITATHEQPPQSLDLRYPTGLAVKWH